MSVKALYNKLSKWPFGKKIFSILFARKAPYFSTISPYFARLEPGFCEVQMKKRKSVQNHIGTVHAIAMCNLAEAAMGAIMEVSLASHLRWIPKGMSVEYLKKAGTDLRGVCEVDPNSLVPGDNTLEIKVYDLQDQIVFSAEINVYVSEKKNRG
jgi:acyl-coenzyme A thioesterase PaaI-like protein